MKNKKIIIEKKILIQLQTLDGVEIEHAERIKAIQNLPNMIPIIQNEEEKYAIKRYL